MLHDCATLYYVDRMLYSTRIDHTVTETTRSPYRNSTHPFSNPRFLWYKKYGSFLDVAVNLLGVSLISFHILFSILEGRWVLLMSLLYHLFSTWCWLSSLCIFNTSEILFMPFLTENVKQWDPSEAVEAIWKPRLGHGIKSLLKHLNLIWVGLIRGPLNGSRCVPTPVGREVKCDHIPSS